MKYRRYTKEFKLDALNLVRENGYTSVARELGVSESALRNWAEKYKFTRQSGEQEVIEAAEVMEQNRKLKRRVKELEQANYILKKAAAFFCVENER